MTPQDKAARFHALHRGPSLFVMPNVRDGGSAALMAVKNAAREVKEHGTFGYLERR
jgi:2-methylisocitrate lyase-like PEP mutase family enzyme